MWSDAKVVERRILDPLIIVVRDADENCHVASFFEIQDKSCVLNRLPCGFQEQAMLRIYVRRFSRRDTKKLGVKLIDLIQETTAFGESLSGNPWLGIIIAPDIPSIWRDIGDSILSFNQQFPERLRVNDTTGEAAANSNYGYTIFLHTRLREPGR